MAFVIIISFVIQNPYGCMHKMSKNTKICLKKKTKKHHKYTLSHRHIPAFEAVHFDVPYTRL